MDWGWCKYWSMVTGGDLNSRLKWFAVVQAQNIQLYAVGGDVSNNTQSGVTESYNGSSWTEVNDLNTARAYYRYNRNKHIIFSLWWRFMDFIFY